VGNRSLQCEWPLSIRTRRQDRIRAMAGMGQSSAFVDRRRIGRSAPEAAINEEPSECVSLPYSDELTPNARSSAWFGVQGGNRVQRAALLPSGCFSLYASYFPVE
jgi:hypothetical protein